MNESDLIHHFPRLWHMAEDGSFESILEHGLLSTTALLDLYGIQGVERAKLESMRRPESVPISRKGLPNAVVRDQKPLTESALEKCLMKGTTPREWFKALNERAFFWLSRNRLKRLLGARAYRDRPQIVLTVDTKSLVDSHRDSIELSPINSGSTIFNPMPRGRDTFLKIVDFPFDERRESRSVENSVAELVVLRGVPDLKDHLIVAHRVYEGKKTELWRRKGAGDDEGP